MKNFFEIIEDLIILSAFFIKVKMTIKEILK